MRHPKLVTNLIVLAALAALVAIGGSPPASAGGKNQIRGVAIRDEAGVTTVRIQGSGTPTFTVYKLERPTRVVIDVAQATLDRSVRGDEPSATFPVGSWAVSQVAAMAMEDGSTSVRVVVTLARPGRYDVKADGKDVVVKVTARDPAPATANSEELAATKQELSAARRAAEIEQKKAKDAVAAAAAAKKAAEDAAKAAANASSSERASADQRVAAAKAEAARARAAAEKAEASAQAATQRAESSAKAAAAQAEAAKAAAAEQVARARSAADVEIAKAKTAADAEVAKAKIAADAEVAKATAARVDAEARAARADAEVAKAKTAADAEIAKMRAAAAADRAAAERDREDAAKARADAERTVADAKTKFAKVEADRKRVEAGARAAEQRERDAQTAAQKAAAERKAALDAVARAEAERTKAAGASTDAVKARAVADEKIKDAEARLARAEAARVAAENARKNAEKAAVLARQEADRATASARKDAAAAQAAIAAASSARTQADAATREALTQRAAAESQRAAAEQRKADTLAEAERAETRRARAESQRAEADAATREAMAQRAAAESQRAQAEADAARAAEQRRREEAAAAQAASARKTEEAAAAQAASARKSEEAAAARARAARQAEEQAMQAAASARSAVEARKQAAERGADEAERAVAMERDAAKVARDRKRAAEDAEAEARAAARRKASADEIAAARAEATRLAAEREKAERELADRTREVARTRTEAERLAAAKTSAAKEAERLAAERTAATAEVARLKQAAAEARDARAREVARLADVTRAREAEEKALARVRSTPAPAPVPVAPAPVRAEPADPERAKRVERGGRVEAPRPTAKIAAVRFAPADNEHTVVVDIDGKGATAELLRTGTRKAELVVHGATLPAALARTLDTTRFGGPIRTVSTYTDPKSGDVRVVVELTSDVTPRFDTSGGDLRLAFAASSKVRTQSVPGPVVGGFGATSTPVTQTSVAQLGRKKVYRGPTIELDFKDADIHDLLRTLADVGRVNIVVPEEVRAQVTVRMKRVPWDQALDVILASKGLGYRKEGNLYRVAPQKQLDAEDEAEAARLRAMVDMEAPRPEVYRLNYTDAESVKPTLEPLLSPKGKIEVDKRTNAIVVNDVSRNRREIIDLATLLDTQTPQISIEARIVEARSQYERQIGIQWGGRALAGAAGGNATGLIFPSTVGFTGGANDDQKPEDGVSLPADFAVNLPANGTQGALGLTLGSVGGNVNINLRLSALEETGTVRIISAPKVTVLNNIEAEMKQGVKIPISIVSAEGTQTQFVRAELSLKVTPYVSQRDCAIMMDVQVTKDEPDFVNTGARGDPTILNKEAKTRMLVNDGETSVMGGIYTRNSGLSYSKIPFFADIPVLGWLFKRRIETDDRAELLIFITPKITNKASLRCAP